MRHVTTLLLILCFTGISAQSLKKADKEFDLGHFEIAAQNYLTIAQKEPSNGHVTSRLGHCYRILNDLEKAANWYEKAIAGNGADPKTLFYLGNVQKMLGQYQLANKTFEKYALAQPSVGKHFSASCDFAEQMINTPSPYVVRPEYLNTSADEFGPSVYESFIVFSTTKPDANNKGQSHLVISSLDQNNYLKPPAPLRTVFDQTDGEGPLSYSTEENIVFFAKNNFETGLRHIPESGMKMSLFYALLDGDGGWTEIKPFPFNGSGYSSGFPSLSQDGKTLFFASDRPDGYGGYDIYVSRKIGDTWTTPENLGPKVNTQGNEITPFFDGTTLYFSSDWHKGLGGYDCFKATRSGSEWNRVFHLGASVNSSGDDFGFVHHPIFKISYFASNRTGGKGNYDLYRAIRQTDEIIITVKDTEGTAIENAVIDMSACSEGTYRSDITGTYQFQALGGFSCDLTISKTGYTPKTIAIAANGEQKMLDYNIVLSKAAEKIKGFIVNGVSKKPEQDVLIRATNQNSGQSIETYSAPDGSYSLGMDANSVYVIRYSKVGFTDAHNRINTGEKVDESVLGKINFDPVYAAIPPNTIDNPTSSTSNNSPSTLGPNGGFAVQVAASDASKGLDMKPFQKLKGMGELYAVQEKGFTKVRVGTFKSRAAANVAKRSIVKLGYPKAFIVSQAGAINSSADPIASDVVVNSTPKPVEKPDIKSEAPIVKNTYTEPKNSSSNNSSTSSSTSSSDKPVVQNASSSNRINNKYKVRLATYKNTNYFKPEKILSLGSIEKLKQGDLTVMLLVAYDSLYEAKQVMEKVRTRGFKTAHVVLDKDGKLIRQR